jgi:hypothetical protein
MIVVIKERPELRKDLRLTESMNAECGRIMEEGRKKMSSF